MAGFFGGGSNQPVVQVLEDPYTPGLSHQLHFFDHPSELHWSCQETKGEGPELVGKVLEVEPEVFPGPGVKRDVKIGVTEISEVTHSPCWERNPDCFWGCHGHG